MQSTKAKKAEELGRKAKLAQSYQELLDEFNDKELRSVGNYTLGRLIGKGSFGKVYLATHKLTNGSKVVLKSANKDDANLAREIHHHRQFVHPHIARLYEVIVTESLVWLVLEYCPGDELYNYLLKHGRLPVEKVQKTFAQLVGAVCYVHQQSCVHRDLKLENILLDKHENVKLCDFGFTREYEGKANYLQTFCGTICYSAPEMLKGEKYAGEKVDVWSLGVILYALLCGELPFDDDDDNVTRTKILTEEPHYPDYIPPDALSLLKSLLSKRPLLRPSLPEILAHPFLADYAAQQQEILRLERPEPFSTPLEKETLHRMRSAGVNVESVMESVLAQRCDVLAGWWTLLIEKEERKRRRREQKRQEREQEKRASRRFSQASSRLNALATVEESQFVKLGDPPQPRSRGRSERRSGYYPNLNIPDVPDLSDRFANGNLSPDSEAPPPPIDKDSIRSVSTTRARKPIPPPKEGVLRSARSRGSTLHLVTTSDALEAASTAPAPSLKPKKRPSRAIIATWKNWTHWLFENTRRHRSTGKRGNQSAPDLPAKDGKEGPKPVDASPRPQTSKYPGGAASSAPQVASLPKGVVANGFSRGAGSSSQALSSHPATSGISTPPVSGYGSNTTNSNNGGSSSSHHPPRLHTSGSSTYKRHSLSPSPLTPRSTVRRSSGPGLRGRKSTSSSVSSVRSLHYPAHHTHTHSKASSTSSNGSVSTNLSKTPLQATRSPHHSVKVLPATPTTGVFPSNLRLVRDKSAPPLALFNEALPGAGLSSGRGGSGARTPTPGSPNPFSSSAAGGGAGVLFAKRKRNIFKGPMLSFSSSGGGGLHARRDLAEHHGGRSRSGSGGGGGPSSSLSQGEGSSSGGGHHSRSASASGLGRRPSGECAIQEVDEDEEEQEQRLEEIRMQMMGRYSPGVGMTLGQLGLGGPGGFHRMSGMLEEDEDEVEEVDAFSPIVKGPGEIVEEKIYDEDEVVGVEGLGLGVGKVVGEDINDNPGVGDEGGNGNGGGGGGGGNGLGGLQPAPEIKAAGETAKG